MINKSLLQKYISEGDSIYKYIHTTDQLNISGNKNSSYGKYFEVFKPHDIILLKNIKKHGYHYVKNEVIQMINFGGTLMVGYFNSSGSGSGIELTDLNSFIEGVNFTFK